MLTWIIAILRRFIRLQFQQTTSSQTEVGRLVTTCGQSFELRPVLDGDVGLLEELLAALSPRSQVLRYQHLLSSGKQLHAEAVRLASCDHVRREALVVLEHDGAVEQAVAVVELACGDDASAELAIIVWDDYQGSGIGKAALARMVVLARAQGLVCLRIDTLLENTGMCQLARHLGLSFEMRVFGGEVTFDVRLG